MSKKMQALVVGAVIVVGGSIFVAGLSVYKPGALRNAFGKPSYSAVYLSTGEVYVGKLSTFPKLTLTDAYLLQTVVSQDDPAKRSFQLAPLREALWSPDKSKIYLNREHVIFSASIGEDSQIGQTLKGK